MDAFVTIGGEATSAAVEVVGEKSGLTPIVFIAVVDPVGRGLVKSRESLPIMTFMKESVTKQGGLVCYGPSYYKLGSQSARLVDKVLKGEEPKNIPIERPMSIKFVLSLKFAETLGLKLTSQVLAETDKIVE